MSRCVCWWWVLENFLHFVWKRDFSFFPNVGHSAQEGYSKSRKKGKSRKSLHGQIFRSTWEVVILAHLIYFSQSHYQKAVALWNNSSTYFCHFNEQLPPYWEAVVAPLLLLQNGRRSRRNIIASCTHTHKSHKRRKKKRKNVTVLYHKSTLLLECNKPRLSLPSSACSHSYENRKIKNLREKILVNVWSLTRYKAFFE